MNRGVRAAFNKFILEAAKGLPVDLSEVRVFLRTSRSQATLDERIEQVEELFNDIFIADQAPAKYFVADFKRALIKSIKRRASNG